MKRRARLVAATGAAWIALSLTAVATDSRQGEVIAVLAGIALLLSVGWLLRAAERERARWQHVLDGMHAAVVVFDSDDKLLLANAQFRSLYQLGDDAQAALGMTFEAFMRQAVGRGLVPEATGREEDWLRERIARHRDGAADGVLQIMSDGRWRRVIDQSLGDGSRLGFSVDVTAMIEAQRAADGARQEAEHAHQRVRAAHEAAAEEHALLIDAIESLPNGFAFYDSEDRLVLCNDRYREIYSDSAPAILIGASFESIVRYGLKRGQYPQAGILAGEREAWLAERVRRHREPDGVPLLQELSNNQWLRIDERRTRSGGVAGVRTDVTELVRARQAVESSRRAAEEAALALRAANAQLEELSATDALTGLANRRRFDTRLAEEAQRARRHGSPLALLLVDIDHFKLYNDLLGHPQGDRALQAVAAVLRQQARRPGELVARVGGEEFAVLLPHADATTAAAVAERCSRAMATLALPHATSPTAPHVTLSIGAAQWLPQAHEDLTSLLRRADAALYAAKAAGRARCVQSSEFIASANVS